MIFIGDICHPFSERPDFSLINTIRCTGEYVIGNLEGTICSRDFNVPLNGISNNISVLEELNRINCGALTISNNHYFDFP